jgi:hypothetical protein
MAIRTLNSLLGVVLLSLFLSAPALACFGPKLFVGAGPDVRQETLFALVTLYVEEKTGVESTLVEVEKGQNPLDLLTEDKADLVFVAGEGVRDNVVFQAEGQLSLVTGTRPREELQFTTVLPAIRKLQRLLESEDIAILTNRVEAGESAMAVARKFLMKRRWI